MDRETEQRTLVSGSAFSLLVDFLRDKKCRCARRVELKLDGLCVFCRNVEKHKKAFPLEFQAACEFVALDHARETK
jgi:hypothetical protein